MLQQISIIAENYSDFCIDFVVFLTINNILSIILIWNQKKQFFYI